MPNELNLRLDPALQSGLHLTAIVRHPSGTQQGSGVSMHEPAAGYYTANFSLVSLPDYEYIVEFLDDDSGRLVGTGLLHVKNGSEYRPDKRPNAEENADAVWNKTLP